MRAVPILLLLAIHRFAPAADAPPKSLDPRLTIELFAEHPQLRTPTGIDVDARGRVWVIESNTHFRPENYDGHPSDRLLILTDTDGDGRADDVKTFADGFQFAMSVAVRPVWMEEVRLGSRDEGLGARELESNTKAGRANDLATPAQELPSLSSLDPRRTSQVFLAERSGIWLLEDTDGDDACDRRTKLVTLETEGNYPHNGLAGFAFDALGWLYFGLGENLGAPYRLRSRDEGLGTRDSTAEPEQQPQPAGTPPSDSSLDPSPSSLDPSLSGGGEGGNVYRMRPDGTQLTHWATGFWNPHASCVDASGRLFTVDNDADSRPPCRLLHVIEGGDYGFRFRNGRRGLHPFTSWNGEIPGTLPMVAGTGEAPSGIVAYEHDAFPEEYLGNLLVTSWGDHRIDRFRLQWKGESFRSIAEPVITGGENFRPVGIALAPDGSLYVSDWVLKDYNLHGMGRVWRVKSIGQQREDGPSPIDVRQSSDRLLLRELLGSLKQQHRRAAARRLLDFPMGDLTLREARSKFERVDGQPVRSRITWDVTYFTHTSTSGKQVSGPETELENQANWLEQVDQRNVGVDAFGVSRQVQYLATQDYQETLLRYWYKSPRRIAGDELRSKTVAALAARRRMPNDVRIVQLLLSDSHSNLRRIGVQWAAEEKLTDLRPQVEAVLKSEPMTTDLFLATLAALEMLDGKDPKDFDQTPPGKYVFPLLSDPAAPAAVKAQALRLVDPADPGLTLELLKSLLASEDDLLRLEAIRSLSASPAPTAATSLSEIAKRRLQRANAGEDEPVLDREEREAVLGLSAHVTQPVARETLYNLLNAPLSFREEVIRALRRVAGEDPEVLSRIRASAGEQTGQAEEWVPINAQLALIAGPAVADGPAFKLSLSQSRPDSDAAWTEVAFARSEPRPSGSDQGNAPPTSAAPNAAGVAPRNASQSGVMSGNTLPDGRDSDGRDAEAGERVFFHPNGPRCYQCHTVNGRGGRIGPDLSRVGAALSREKLLDSILNPSKEVAPQFTTWNCITTAGAVHTGMIVFENKGETTLGTSDGKLVTIPTIDIETRTPQPVSVMPEKLEDRLTVVELRDLLAFLESLR